MNKKMTYEAPETEQMEIKFEKDFLDGSVGAVTGANFNWSGSEEDW
ncbi:MAG: hypothetical protein IKO04_05510 [Bacteroidales bacterium]|nr:hypothetical protein [Bacteroidales bacterium]